MGDGDFYSVYYSAGVLLEAEFMAVKSPAGMEPGKSRYLPPMQLSVARSRPTVKTPAELS